MTQHFTRSFVPLQKSRRNHCSYVWKEALSNSIFVPAQKLSGVVWYSFSFHIILLNSLRHQLFIFFFLARESLQARGDPGHLWGKKLTSVFISTLGNFIVLGYGNTRGSIEPQNVISNDWETWKRISHKWIFWRHGLELEARGGLWDIFELFMVFGGFVALYVSSVALFVFVLFYIFSFPMAYILTCSDLYFFVGITLFRHI